MSKSIKQRKIIVAKAARKISRRDFLRLAGAVAASLVLTGCQPSQPSPTPTPQLPTTDSLPQTATIQSPTITPVLNTAVSSSPTQTPIATATLERKVTTETAVAIAKTTSYDRDVVRKQVQALVEGLGGLGDVVKPGNKVAIKINLTGGVVYNPDWKTRAPETYVTHPEVVRALLELVRDAGAGQIYIVEGVFDDQSYEAWGYTDLAKEFNVQLIDLNVPAPYKEFASVPVGDGWFIYEKFNLNPILQEVDTFMSVAKMKCHYECGITLSMKNLIGLAPVTLYRSSTEHYWRSALHGNEDEIKQRLPRVILDLNRARPIHFALIDGIKSAEGGEVPRGSFKPVEPGVLFAGKNPLATDVVGTALMSFDPQAEAPNKPFLRGDNYFNIAASIGMGTNRLEEIKVVGDSIEAAKYQFHPSTSM